ncbi:AraC family transcriptional regulator [Flectobacillus roseus]|uniref:AraC family transcriptional regulator n=1 Tax=Flectobacillus roseus TaxID=502259 RepID=A0ABT6Y736_9BACT|nr:AraC family transcriptional regulator [Flectobacillus roseus]MDI9859383.1 AraC family transcriptional regulator [Flectobacillus roseus]MDI9871583.1 AraC family transcriptional regulator [Flectobacillus roseus]
MKPHLLQVATVPNRSFSIRQEMVPNVNSRWHCHSEVEIVLFHRGSGTQFVGDSIRHFQAGDVVLIGSDLPHYWHYDEFEEDINLSKEPFATVIHFSENFWGDRFLNLPENQHIKNALEKAKRGIFLENTLKEKVAQIIEKLYTAEGAYRLILLMECLLKVNQSDEKSLLASMGFRHEITDRENERINIIYSFTLQNFKNKISLEEVASHAGLAPNSFCRYFKSRTGKQYSRFLLEIRVGYACKLLLNGHLTLKQICYESGFNNFTCFHEKFKLLTGSSPLNYLKIYGK